MSSTIPNLSNLRISPGEVDDRPYSDIRTGRSIAPVDQRKQFKTGSHQRDRRYTPIDIDTIDQDDAYESSLAALAKKRSSSAVSMVIKTSVSDDEVARSLVKLGEGIARRLVGYHPDATYDVDVVTAQRHDVAEISFAEAGIRLFKESMCSTQQLDQQMRRVMLKRADVEARMMFLRVAGVKHYDVKVTMPDGGVVSAREHF